MMLEFRVYFLQGDAIIAADVIQAASDTEAADRATQAIDSYPWARSLIPDRLEVWQGKDLRQTRPYIMETLASRVRAG
jgi:hypothetical protein